ncbi:hypothetical protein [Bosea sp. (in: a-proteobacteria)]|uniref:hypothetical protein n=1 Tax=Bosea sp. (in: a-proteobacteria) TaxID=1871050 RepID=UPI00260BCAF8|nr:hypothetical protein [Bosea sp. (in: a-proteobacteria)]MCO5089962.1 hypothetical protein [Bosea sp. (in: a-proteobacteria)]
MTRSPNARRLALAAGFVSAFCFTARAAEPVRLITPEEAGLPAATAASGQERNMTRGPGIDALAPPAIGVNGAFRFAVKFKPRNGVAIDPASVRVTYDRQPAVDLTARVKPFITADGIEAPAVVAPPGRHVILVEATDKEGRIGRGRMTLTIEAAK